MLLMGPTIIKLKHKHGYGLVLAWALLIVSVFLMSCRMAIAQSNEILTLNKALNIAIANNPNLAQIKARSEAMAAIPSQAGSLPDPIISFNAMNLPVDSFDLAQENMTQLQGGISQAIPFPGKLATREKVALHLAQAANHDVEEARWILLRDVKEIWWSLFYWDRALEINQLNQNLLRQFVEIALTKYKVGEGLQQDVLLAQLELSKFLDNEFRLKSSRATAVARLNALLDRPADEIILIPERINTELPVLKSQTQLFHQAEQYRALLASKREAVNAAESRLDLAKQELYPDFNIGAYYGGRQDTPSGDKRSDFLSLKLSMNVPIFAGSKQSKTVDQRTKELMQQRYALQDEWNQVRAEIARVYHEYSKNKNQVQLFHTGIIPQARQTVASMLAGYQVNKVDFLNLVRSQITLFNYETQYWLALTEANQAIAYLNTLVGVEEVYE